MFDGRHRLILLSRNFVFITSVVDGECKRPNGCMAPLLDVKSFRKEDLSCWTEV